MTSARGLDGLPQRIAAVRRQLGLSQRVFAERIGVTRNVVIRYERGHHGPSVRTLDRIAKLGGVTVEWLLDGGQRKLAAAGENREWKVAVEALREVWQDPGRRPGVLRLLRGLASLTSGRSLTRAGYAMRAQRLTGRHAAWEEAVKVLWADCRVRS